MDDFQVKGVPGLDRLSSCVAQRTDKVWRQFLVAQARRVAVVRRREKTTQKLYLFDHRDG